MRVTAGLISEWPNPCWKVVMEEIERRSSRDRRQAERRSGLDRRQTTRKMLEEREREIDRLLDEVFRLLKRYEAKKKDDRGKA